MKGIMKKGWSPFDTSRVVEDMGELGERIKVMGLVRVGESELVKASVMELELVMGLVMGLAKE